MNNELTHIAIIMDGNRRWAVSQGLPKLMGHTKGTYTLKKIANTVADKGIKHLTVWALSTENLKNRSEKELAHIFALVEKIQKQFKSFEKREARMNVIGDLSKLPEKTRTILEDMMERTKDFDNYVLTFAINYGGRDELLRAMKKIKNSGTSVDNLSETDIAQYLDTADMPEPELIIRTGGAKRLSGFMPWQSTYSELYFTDTFWPAFSDAELDEAIEYYQACLRNKGK